MYFDLYGCHARMGQYRGGGVGQARLVKYLECSLTQQLLQNDDGIVIKDMYFFEVKQQS